MPDSLRLITQHLQELADAPEGDERSAERILPLVYQELRKLAASKLAGEKHQNTLQPTALAHEAFLRLLGPLDENGKPRTNVWDSTGHFFASAAIAMRRILVERGRRRQRRSRLSQGMPLPTENTALEAGADVIDIVALDEALKKLEIHDARKARVVMLRFFCNLSVEETAAALELSPATVKNDWAYSRAWLKRQMLADGPSRADEQEDDTCRSGGDAGCADRNAVH